MNPLEERIASEVRRRGPLPLREVVDAALYDPEHGFYATGGAAGRRGDFMTSPEVGPLFGAVIARAADAQWHAIGEPDPFIVIDAGAGPGTLALAFVAAEPECRRAVRYILVERSAALRARHAEHLSLAEAAHVLDPDRGGGPVLASIPDLPRLRGPALVIANELLDNLPFDLAQRGEDGWREVRVALGDSGFCEELVPAGPDVATLLDRLAPGAPPGARAPVQRAAAEWLRHALAVIDDGGTVVVVDYAATTAELARRPQAEWLRTYRTHQPGADLLTGLGTQDITSEVAVDQLSAVRRPDRDRSQAEFLAANGLAELVEEGRRIWSERAHIGDLEAVRARSRIGEADALTDAAGLGSFRVLEWTAA